MPYLVGTRLCVVRPPPGTIALLRGKRDRFTALAIWAADFNFLLEFERLSH